MQQNASSFSQHKFVTTNFLPQNSAQPRKNTSKRIKTHENQQHFVNVLAPTLVKTLQNASKCLSVATKPATKRRKPTTNCNFEAFAREFTRFTKQTTSQNTLLKRLHAYSRVSSTERAHKSQFVSVCTQIHVSSAPFQKTPSKSWTPTTVAVALWRLDSIEM